MSARPTQSRSRPGLNRGRIVDATLELLEERGLNGLSMRALASRLECEAMSLYRYVPSKAALLELVAEAVVAEIELPNESQLGWEDSIRVLFRELRRVALRRPAAFSLVIRGPITSLGAKVLERGMRALTHAGLSEDEAAHALCALLAFAVGAIGNELAASQLGKPLARPAGEDAGAWAATPQARHFVEVMQRTDYESEFEAGLTTLIRALAH